MGILQDKSQGRELSIIVGFQAICPLPAMDRDIDTSVLGDVRVQVEHIKLLSGHASFLNL